MKGLSVFQVILLAVFGALAVAGVLIFALFVGGSASNTIGPISIWGTLDPTAFSVVLRQVSENEPRLAQVTYVQKDSATYENSLTDALASGAGPDLFLLTQDYALRDASRVTPIPFTYLSQAQFSNTFVDAANPLVTPGGVLAIPVLADPLVMYWNKDILATAGFAAPPQYWDELSGLTQKVVKKDDSGTVQRAAVPFGEYVNVDNAKAIIATLILQAGGTITSQDSVGHLVPALGARTSGPQQATESALRFYTQFSDPSTPDYSWNRSLPSSRAAFAAGNLALYFGYASEAPLIARINPNLNFSPAALPQIRGAARAVGAAKVYALATTRTSRNPQGAITVASLIAGSDVSKALSIALGIPSARRDSLSLGSIQGSDDLFAKQAIIGKSWLDPDPEKTNGIFQSMVESITSGSARPSEAIGRADQQMAQLISQ